MLNGVVERVGRGRNELERVGTGRNGSERVGEVGDRLRL